MMDEPTPGRAVSRIREAEPADCDTIAEFNARLALETESKRLDPAILARGVAMALADPDRLRYCVAIGDGGRLVGQAAYSREWSDWRCGWIWWLQSVYVDSDYRGLGVFRALLRHLREKARADPEVIGLRLYVEQENLRAQQVYEALGLRPGGYFVLEDLWGLTLDPG